MLVFFSLNEGIEWNAFSDPQRMLSPRLVLEKAVYFDPIMKPNCLPVAPPPTRRTAIGCYQNCWASNFTEILTDDALI